MRSLEPIPERRPLPAWILSIVVHFVILATLGLLWRPPLQGMQEGDDRPIGIALVKSFPERNEYETPAEKVDVDSGDASTGEQAAPGDLVAGVGLAPLAGSTAVAPVDLDGMLAEFTATPSPSFGGPSADAASGETAGIPGQSGSSLSGFGDSGTKVHAEMFGVKGYGHRFVYVMDRSDSMNSFGGRPLAAAKREVLRSVRSIGPEQEFQIIFYNERTTPLRSPGQMTQLLHGDKQTHSLVTQVVNFVYGSGGTNHMDAIKMALRMRPDVVFLLTDARVPKLSGYQLREIQARARANDTTIHTIEFGTDAVAPTDSFLEDLATDNGGEYRYINVGSL